MISCPEDKELLGRAPAEEEGSFRQVTVLLPPHHRKLVSSLYTNSHPSTLPNRPIVGTWLGETKMGLTVGGPRKDGT